MGKVSSKLKKEEMKNSNKIQNREKKKKDESMIIQQELQLTLKLLFLGDYQVGKTMIVTTFTHGNEQFKETYLQTYGIDFRVKNILVDEGFIYQHNQEKARKVNLHSQYWDIPANAQMSLISMVIKDADGIVLVYDATSPQSFEEIKTSWMPKILNIFDKKLPPILLMGNKIDVFSKGNQYVRVKIKNDVAQFAENNKLKSAEVSAKTGENLNYSILTFINEIIEEKLIVFYLKEVYLNLLLFLNEDFDDDLLQDAIQLLGE